MYSSTLSLTSALDGRGWSTSSSELFTSWKEKWYSFYRRLGGPQGGGVWTGAENVASTGIRSSDRQARSNSLYRLSYPSPLPL